MHRAAGLRLRDDAYLPALDEPVPFEGQLIDRVDHEPVPDIEIRRPHAVGDVVAVLDDDDGRAQGVGIGRLRERVRGIELKTLQRPLVGRQPQSFVV